MCTHAASVAIAIVRVRRRDRSLDLGVHQRQGEGWQCRREVGPLTAFHCLAWLAAHTAAFRCLPCLHNCAGAALAACVHVCLCVIECDRAVFHSRKCVESCRSLYTRKKADVEKLRKLVSLHHPYAPPPPPLCLLRGTPANTRTYVAVAANSLSSIDVGVGLPACLPASCTHGCMAAPLTACLPCIHDSLALAGWLCCANVSSTPVQIRVGEGSVN